MEENSNELFKNQQTLQDHIMKKRFQKSPSIKSQEKVLSKKRMAEFLRPLKQSIERLKSNGPVSTDFFPGYMALPLRLWHEMQVEIELSETKLGKEKVSELVLQFADEAAANPHVINHEYVIMKLRDARSGCL